MSLRDRVRGAVAAGLAMALTSVASPADPLAPPPPTPGVQARRVKRGRRRETPLPVYRPEWYQADIEAAARLASNGDLSIAAQLYRALARDGTIRGLLGTRTGGLVRLPKRFRGDDAAMAAIAGTEGRNGLFDVIFPQSELEQLDNDGVVLGVGVGEFVQRDCDRYPTFVRLDPEFLIYRWSEDRWYYRSIYGLLPITPGDGRWVLHTPYGQHEPWNRGLWQALARSFVAKEHAFMHRENYSSKIANPARVAVAPQGAGEAQKQAWFQKVMAWGMNTVFGMTPGYDVKLLESNGRGYEVFNDTIQTSDREFAIAIAGQVVTVDGGAGFANANIHATIRSDIVQGDGNALASTLNAQALPHVIYDLCGPANDVTVEWDTRPPADLAAGAGSLSAAAKAMQDLTAALAPYGKKPDVAEIASRFAVPILQDKSGTIVPDQLPVAPSPDSLPATPATGEDAATGENTGEEAPPVDNAAALAAKMTELRLPKCEHGHSNRCWICGIERVRDVELGPDGQPQWAVAWRPIAPAQAQEAA